jgi:hypothetical protein
MNLQPIAAYFLPAGWSVGYSGNVLANWKAQEDSEFGQKWNIQLIVAPVLPKLIKAKLSDPRHMTFGLGS